MQLPVQYQYIKDYFEDKLYQFALLDQDYIYLAPGFKYPLDSGGKRLRPVLVFAVYLGLQEKLCKIDNHEELELTLSDSPSPLGAALALEYIHSYSLVHDDLPAMDNDDFRRGHLALHRKMGEAMAILSGDALLTAAFLEISRSYRDYPEILGKLTANIARAALLMVEGQVADTVIDSEHLKQPGELDKMIINKTGALLASSFECGGILAGADSRLLLKLRELGIQFGRLFQIADDILDVKGSRDKLGKTPGKDAKNNKITAVTLYGLKEAQLMAAEIRDKCERLLKETGLSNPFFETLLDFVITRNH
ncbi:MAG: polyprenyl synthetase family protein [Deltaproteobacteria bacterium]|jgi:geranylgeranyl diphosphate synthase type II|nr:polyprenyl synthetase family protein [Deltaproteobacteria bacterium]